MTKGDLKKHLQQKIEKEEKRLSLYLLFNPNSLQNVESCNNSTEVKQLTLQNSQAKVEQKIERLKNILEQINQLNAERCANCGKEILVVKKNSNSLCTACATKTT